MYPGQLTFKDMSTELLQIRKDSLISYKQLIIGVRE